MAALAASVLGAGCDEHDRGVSTEADRGSDRPAVALKQRTGQIILPLDRFSASHRERGVIEYAGELLIADCMGRAGHGYRVIDRRTERPEPSRRYGPWHRGSILRHGYRAVDTPLAQRFQANKMAPRPIGEQRALASCSRRARRISLPDPLPGDLAAFSTHSSALESQRAKRAIQAWHSCLKDSGIIPPGSADPWTPRSALHGSERQIVTALADLRCKSRVRLVTRLAHAEAAIQSRWIAANHETLREQQDRIAAAVSAAELVIARLEPQSSSAVPPHR
mgnify:CR=1 FL=1